jgi:quinone-modifying oxidoreductase subunit QmoC
MSDSAESYEKSHQEKRIGPGASLVYKVRRWIKYEEELNQHFGDDVAHLAHGEKLFSCIQCGTCSSICPLSHHMDFTPRRIISMVREGFEEEVLGSLTIWLCSSCYSCTVNCPKQIRITDVMYALKQKAIARHIYPKRFPVAVLAEEFFKYVGKHGRNSEGRLMMNLSLKTNPFRLFKYTRLGWRLLRTGRFSLKEEHVENRKDLQKLLHAVERVQEEIRT